MKITLPSILLLFLTTTINANTTQLNPIKDNTLYETNTGSTSNGAGFRLFIGKTGGIAQFKKRRALMQFDLSSIPAGSTINSATLTVTVTNAAPGGSGFDANIHLLLSDWGEGTSIGLGNGGPSTVGDATWLHRFFNTTNWNTAGGDFFATTSGTGTFTTSSFETVTFSSTSSMIADVQLWLDTAAMNFGWVMLGDEVTDQNARGISSREGGNQPVLTIDFTPVDLIFANGFE